MIAIMVAVMVFGIVNLSISAEAEETNIAAGTVGEGISWVIGADGVLTISGSGEAFDFSWYSPPWLEYADQITSVKIEEGITQIPDTLLCSLNYATKIYIPSTVSYIGTIAFDNSFGIEEYVVAADNESYKSEDGVIYSKDGEQLVRFPSAHHAEEFTIPESVSYIRNEAFACSRTLKVLNIGENVLTMGNNFLYNTMVEEIIFETAAPSIPYCAFSYCQMESFVVPDTVEELNSSIFFCATSLKTLVIGSGVKEIGSYLVYSTPNLSIIHYNGTAEGWSSINIDAENEALFAKEIHYVSYKDGYGASCVDGYEGGLYCEECELYITGDVILATDEHTPGESVSYVDEANCVENRYSHSVIYCTVCDIELIHDVAIFEQYPGHSWSDGVCTVCGEECEHYDDDYDGDCDDCKIKDVISYDSITLDVEGTVDFTISGSSNNTFLFTPTESGYYVLTSDNGGDNDIDPVAKIYCGGIEYEYGDDYEGTLNFNVVFEAEAGSCYLIELGIYNSNEASYKYLLSKAYIIEKHPTSDDTEIKISWGAEADYQWYEYAIGEEITDKNADVVNTYGEGSSYVEGKGWIGDFWDDEKASFFTVDLKAGEFIVLCFGYMVEGRVGIWNLEEDFVVEADYDESQNGIFLFTAPYDGSYEVYSYYVVAGTYLRAYKVSDIAALDGETFAVLKNPEIGGIYVCSVEVNGSVLISETLFYNYAISHLPTSKEPFVEVNSGEAGYQWSEMVFGEEYTSDNAEVVDWGNGKSSYSAENGWSGVLEYYGTQGFLDYLAIDLKANESVTIVVFGDAFGIGIYDYENDVGDWLECEEGECAYTMTVDSDGSYIIYAGINSGEVRLKAYVGKAEYVTIEGATDSAYYPAKSGYYSCKVTFENGKNTITSSYLGAHEHKDADSDDLCDECGAAIPKAPDTSDASGAEDGEKALTGGQIALIVIGSVIVAGAGAFSVVWFVVKKKTFAELVGVIKAFFEKIAAKSK